ncbi:MAG: hypothetical protein AMJ84_11030 [Acidithiobacillales bacterium SM23_46]|jgi:hypothetical protein|nr:MAG: hypothetical protein AMS22_10390 [Thiotrichales bacterium SG8_50]KPK68512.1 MAG: hypothetical protein AMJ84_11030 [Acidithiobacillales bacterium SM23_46]
MIVYELRCDANHRFEGWFVNSGEFEDQLRSGKLVCPVCGATKLRRLPTAAHLSSGGATSKQGGLNSEQPKARTALDRLVEYVRTNYEDVGAEFPEEARRIHYGESDARNIRGVATVSDVNELIEEGIAVTPLPTVDKEKLN